MPQALTEESFLPSSLFTEVKGQANGKDEKRDVFILSHPDILDLMRYVWTGCYLPSEREEYISVMDIHKEGVSAVSDEIDLIVKAYADIKKDNTQFRDVTWKQLINLAGQVSNYAKKAGGSYNSSYYAGLIEAIADYNAESNKPAKDQVKTKLAEAKEAVLEFSKAMLTRVTQLLDDTEKCMNDLTTFKNLTKNHGVALKNTNDKVKGLLEGEDGEIKRLNTEITKLQKDLAAEQEEYHHDVVVAATTPTYAWCTIFGFIAAVTVASIYGKRATDMLNIIDETQKKIDNDKKKVEAAVIVTADCQRMTDGNDTVIDLIDKAIKTLGKMQAAWQLMKNDLTGIKDSASEDQGEIPGVAMEKRRLNGMIEQWNSLSTQVEYFEKVAYVSEPEYMTIKEFIKKIKGDGK